MLQSYMKKWSDFKSSPIKPLFWMLIGPLLICLTLLVSLPIFYDSFLPCIAILSLLSIWKWRLNGFLLTLLTFSLYFCFHFFFGAQGIPLWKFGWGCSFALALTISFLVMEELKNHYITVKKDSDKTIADLKLSLHTLGEKTASEKRKIETKVDKLQEKLERSHEEVTALLQLVEASRIEVKKTYKQNETLSAESLKHHRQIETLKLQTDENLKELEILQEQHLRLLDKNRTRLKKLNQMRTEYAQMQMLFDTSQEDFKKFRSVILNQRQQIQEKTSSVEPPLAPAKLALKPPPQPKIKANQRQNMILKTLEKDKRVIKKAYEQTQIDHEKLTGLLKKAKANEEERVHTLENQTLEKKKKMEQTKSELIALEREIFVIKKGMQQQGIEVS